VFLCLKNLCDRVHDIVYIYLVMIIYVWEQKMFLLHKNGFGMTGSFSETILKVFVFVI